MIERTSGLLHAADPRAFHAASHPIGDTDLIEVGGVLAKLECTNPTGSIKDRIARFMLDAAMERGELHRGDVVVEATSGNTGIALAHVAPSLGCRVLIFMPEHMSPERARMIRRLGGEVRLTPRDESFAGTVARRDAYRGRAGFYVPDQFGHPDNVRCHRIGTGREILEGLRAAGWTRLDAFVAGIGTGGTLMGVSQALREAFPRVLRVAVEPRESPVLSGGMPGEHGILGIGDGFVPEIVKRSEIDEVFQVSTHEAIDTATRLRREFGYCVGVSSGANMFAAFRVAQGGARVVTIWPDSADRYASIGLRESGCADVTCRYADRCRVRTAWLLDPGESEHRLRAGSRGPRP